VLVAATWLYRHSFAESTGGRVRIQLARIWDDDLALRALTPVLVCLVGYLVVYVVSSLRNRDRGMEFRLRIRPVTGMALFFGLVVLTFNTYAFLAGSQAAGQPDPIPIQAASAANLALLIHLGRIAGWLAAVTLVAHAAGAAVWNVFRLPDTTILGGWLFKIAIGLWLLSLWVFLSGWLGVYTPWSVAVFAVAALALGWRDTVTLACRFIQHRWEYRSGFLSLRTLCLLLLAATLAMTLISILRPCPVGWDALEKYLNRSQLVAGRGALVPGGFMFPVELLTSLGYAVLNSAMAAMTLTWFGGVLAILAIVSLGRRFWNPTIGVVAATVWYTMPMVGHLSMYDLKIDTILFFVGILTCWAVMEWIAQPDRSAWLYLAGLLVGVAFTMKLTTVFLFMGLAGMVGYAVFRKGGKKVSLSASRVVRLAGVALLPVVPWMVFNLSTHDWHPGASLENLVHSRNPDRIEITANDWDRFDLQPRETDQQAWRDTYKRYRRADFGVLDYLRLPWDLTMNTTVNDNHVIIGFMFLAILPFVVILWPGMSPSTRLLVALLPGIWIPWIVLGEGVPWYAMAGFLPLSLIIACCCLPAVASRWVSRVVKAALVVSLVANLILLGSTGGHPHILAYTGARITEAQFVERMFPGYPEMVEILEQHRPSPESPNRVYRVGTMLPYFLPDNDRRLFYDNLLVTFAQLDTGHDDSVTLRRLKMLGFRFFLVDLNVLRADPDPSGDFRVRAERFVTFARRHLKVLVHSKKFGHLLFTYRDPS